jgi:hypothetical protein
VHRAGRGGVQQGGQHAAVHRSRAMAILGERWTVVVLREVFNGVRRFDDMRERTGIPRQVLTNRLAALVERGVLRREPYREPGARQRHGPRCAAPRDTTSTSRGTCCAGPDPGPAAGADRRPPAGSGGGPVSYQPNPAAYEVLASTCCPAVFGWK